mgnify:CR=1 FL=1
MRQSVFAADKWGDLMDELIKRINELAKKSKTEDLSEEEKAEQAELRRRYIQSFRQGLMNTLDNVYIMDEDGNKKKVERKNIKKQ